MTDTSLRPRSISEIVDAAFTIYRRNFVPLIVVTALMYSPYMILATFRSGSVTSTSGTLSASTAAAMTSGVLATIAMMVLYVVCYSLVTGAVTQLGSQAYLEGGRADIERAVRATIPRIPSLIVSGFLLGVSLFVGFLCFIVGAFYVAARFFAVSPVVALEGVGALDAFSRSSKLSSGRKWMILGTLALVYGIYFLISMGISLFAVLPAALTGNTWIAVVVSLTFSVLAHPVTSLVTMVLYYDTRIRAEGFDVEHLSSQLDASMAPAATI